jgi:CheY-like chemotaxis protein
MKRPLILSIDDSKAVHSFMNLCFPTDQYELIHAYNALEGIDIIKKQMGDISLVLLDWEMPMMTGPEALVEIRKIGFAAPIVMVTTKNDPAEIGETLDKGATEYVMKPFTPEIILTKVEELLKG